MDTWYAFKIMFLFFFKMTGLNFYSFRCILFFCRWYCSVYSNVNSFQYVDFLTKWIFCFFAKLQCAERLLQALGLLFSYQPWEFRLVKYTKLDQFWVYSCQFCSNKQWHRKAIKKNKNNPLILICLASPLQLPPKISRSFLYHFRGMKLI